MLSFLTSAHSAANPLQSVKAADAWLETLPALDVMARAALAIQALDRMRETPAAIDHAAAQALLHVDRALSPDRRKLFRQYVEGASTGSTVPARIWKAHIDMITAFIGAYEAVLQTALERDRYAAWKALVPGLTVRALHHYALDAKLHIGRHETWIPARWRSLHRIYTRAVELGIERLAVSGGDVGSGTRKWTVEHEYLCTLTLHLLDSGSLSAAQIAWATAQVRAGSARLKLTTVATSDDDFVVDLASDTGLVRGSGGRSGPSLRFLDTTPMIGGFDVTIAAERLALDADSAAGVIARERVSVLEKMRIAMAASHLGEFRRDPREACSVPARVRVGLAAIHRLRKGQDLADGDDPTDNVIEIRPQGKSAWPRVAAAPASDTLCATLAIGDHTLWQVTDRSASGLRIVAQGELAPGRALGALIAVRQSDAPQWRLGVTRRLKRLGSGKTEIGVSLISERFRAIRLRPLRASAQNTGIAVEGLDTAMLGSAIDALYLPPPSRHHTPVLAKSVILPSCDYSAGRELILTSPRSIYTVALRSIVEQRGDWCWATLSIVAKEARAVTAAPA